MNLISLNKNSWWGEWRVETWNLELVEPESGQSLESMKCRVWTNRELCGHGRSANCKVKYGMEWMNGEFGGCGESVEKRRNQGRQRKGKTKLQTDQQIHRSLSCHRDNSCDCLWLWQLWQKHFIESVTCLWQNKWQIIVSWMQFELQLSTVEATSSHTWWQWWRGTRHRRSTRYCFAHINPKHATSTVKASSQKNFSSHHLGD